MAQTNYKTIPTPNVITTQTLIAPEHQLDIPGSVDATPRLTKVNGVENTAALEVQGDGLLGPSTPTLSSLLSISTPAPGTLMYVNSENSYYQCITSSQGTTPAVWVPFGGIGQGIINVTLSPIQVGDIYSTPLKLLPQDIVSGFLVVKFMVLSRIQSSSPQFNSGGNVFINNQNSNNSNTAMTQSQSISSLSTTNSNLYVPSPGTTPTNNVSSTNLYLTNSTESIDITGFSVFVTVAYNILQVSV